MAEGDDGLLHEATRPAWINAVEGLFAKLTKQQLNLGV
jgi:hypothetical protein